MLGYLVIRDVNGTKQGRGLLEMVKYRLQLQCCQQRLLMAASRAGKLFSLGRHASPLHISKLILRLAVAL